MSSLIMGSKPPNLVKENLFGQSSIIPIINVQ
jgi:hypothetical protein